MIWDERWRRHKSRAAALDPKARARFTAACADRAVWRLLPALEQSIVREHLPALLRALDLMWQAVEGGARRAALREQLSRATRELEELEPDEDSPEYELPGWDDLLYAVLGALRCARGSKETVSAAEVANQAHQAVWFQRIYPQTNRPLPMEEMEQFTRQLELNDPVCMEDLAFQLECLRRAAAGEAVPRSTPPETSGGAP
jgi:hypothetical protein